jgi:hypothetical protein
MCYDGYFDNCCPNKHTQRFEIVSILTQVSMKNELYNLTAYNVTPYGIFF